MKPLFKGLLTGLFLQLAIGPVFFFILGITINSSFLNAFCAIAAVTIVDYLYIALSLLGLSKILENAKIKTALGVVSSIVLAVFSAVILKSVFLSSSANLTDNQWTPAKSFISCFALTISSPLTIFFWTGIFSAKAIEYEYTRRQLTLFGVGAGSATFIFMLSSMFVLSLFRTVIDMNIIRVLNCFVGLLLLYYAVSRLLKLLAINRRNIKIAKKVE